MTIPRRCSWPCTPKTAHSTPSNCRIQDYDRCRQLQAGQAHRNTQRAGFDAIVACQSAPMRPIKLLLWRRLGPGSRFLSHEVVAAEDRRSEILRMGWDQLKTSVEGCIACPLCRSRSRTVFGIGDMNADWLYVGEGPGAEEDATGEPFVGQAGKLLDNMLAAIDLKRGRNVYIANIVKCRPPATETPPPMKRISASHTLRGKSR